MVLRLDAEEESLNKARKGSGSIGKGQKRLKIISDCQFPIADFECLTRSVQLGRGQAESHEPLDSVPERAPAAVRSSF